MRKIQGSHKRDRNREMLAEKTGYRRKNTLVSTDVGSVIQSAEFERGKIQKIGHHNSFTGPRASF